MKGGYTVIQDWMLDLDLDLTSIFVYANIFGFSQDGESVYAGTQKWLAERCKCSKETIKRVLRSLTEKGYLEKIERNINGVKFYDYRINPKRLELENCEGVVDNPGGVKMTQGWGQIDPYQNTIENTNKEKYISNDIYKKKAEKIEENPAPELQPEAGKSKEKEKGCAEKEKKAFSFYEALISEGVSSQTASDWMLIRSKKRAVNTVTAFKAIKKQLNLAKESGVEAEECISMAVIKSWAGFEYQWLVNEKAKFNGNKDPFDKRRATDVMAVPTSEYFKPF